MSDYGDDGDHAHRPSSTTPSDVRDADETELPSRPKTRGECAGVERPCPFVSCRFNLYLDIKEKTRLVMLNFPRLEPDEMVDSCALDVAEHGPHINELVALRLNVTKQRIQQIEAMAMHKFRKVSPESSNPYVKNRPAVRSPTLHQLRRMRARKARL